MSKPFSHYPALCSNYLRKPAILFALIPLPSAVRRSKNIDISLDFVLQTRILPIMTKRFSPLFVASIIAGSTLIALFGLQSESSAGEVCTNVPFVGRRCVWVPVADGTNEEGATAAPFNTRSSSTAVCPDTFTPVTSASTSASVAFLNEWNRPVTLMVYNNGSRSAFTVPPGVNNILTSGVNSGSGVCFVDIPGRPVSGVINSLADVADFNPDWQGSPLYMIQNPRIR